MRMRGYYILFIMLAVAFAGFPSVAGANNVASSTLHFQGSLTDEGGGIYTGTIAMTKGDYYVAGGGGEGISTSGGFDVFAKQGACAFVEGYYGAGEWNCDDNDTYEIGYYASSPNDAYASPGGPWGSWYDPDCADYYNYELTLTQNKWFLRHNGGTLGNGNATPMSGGMDWTDMYAMETDVGAYVSPPADPDANDGDAEAFGAGAGYWDMDWTWGSEAIPLEFPGFRVVVTDLGSGQYDVTLTPAGPSEVWVDDDYCDNCTNDGHTWGFDAFDNIQDGVDAVDGSVVNVGPGAYEEQVVISKKVTIKGSGRNATVIQSPVSLPEFFTTSGKDNHPIVYVHDTDNVTIEDLTVNGMGRGDGNYRFCGIAFWNAGGSVDDVHLTGVRDTPFSGNQHGVSIYAFNDTGGPYYIAVSNVDIDDMQKTGIALNGSGLTADVRDCTVTGNGPTDVTAQNGIQFWGSGGSVENCTVTGISYTGGYWSASGILLYYTTPGMQLKNNRVSGCQGALNAYFADNMTMDNNNIFSSNDFEFVWGGDGIVVDSNTFSNNGQSLYVSDSTNLTVSSNLFKSDNNSIVVDGTANGLSFTGNTITADNQTAVVIQPYDGNEPSNVLFADNNITGNVFGMENTTANTVDAKNNWWGAPTGPNHPVTNPCSNGDKVSDNILYSPWLDDGYPAGSQRDHNVENITQSTVYNCIQEAIDAAADGNEIKVLSGTYNQPLNIESFTGLDISGVDKNTVCVRPESVLNHNACGHTSDRKTAVRVVDSTNVSIQHMTMNFELVRANFVYGLFYCNSTGTVNDNVFKNLSLPDAGGGYYEIGSDFNAPDYSDSSRASITITDNTYLDTGRLGIVTHYYVDADIRGNTFYKTTDDFGYAIEIGGPSTGTVKDNVIYGYDTPALSDGSESAGIYIESAWTTALSGITKNVSVEDNVVHDCQYGMWIGNGYDGFAGDVDINVVLKGNTFHDNTDGAVIIQDEDKENGSSVTVSGNGNVLENNGDVGYYIFTQGDGDITVNLNGETISGQQTGIYVEDNATSNSSYSVSIDHSNISGNSSYGINNTVAGFILNAVKNWWGDATGPYDGIGVTEVPPCTGDPATDLNSDGTGNAVSENVNYCSWLIAPDTDGDGIYDEEDNCPSVYNPDQTDTDGDGIGDACDHCNGTGAYDVDNDGICDGDDNCPETPNGPELGSCVKILAGVLESTGAVCTDNGGCNTEEDEMCELDMLDLNENGIGDVCECFADLDSDGQVGIFDLSIMKAEFGRTDCDVNPCDADCNYDGSVGLFDLVIMKNEFGATGCPVLP